MLPPHESTGEREMKSRRSFLQMAAGAGLAGAAAVAGAATPKQSKPASRPFQMMYAPHFGMFKEHAGPDLFAQLEFMADRGFKALEDNGLMGRPVDVQQRIGETLAKRGM